MATVTRRDDLILAIDAGTQSMRAGLIDMDGEILGLVKLPIEPYFSVQPGWAEQHPEYYWEKLCEATLRLLGGHAAARERIRAVAITSQRMTMVNVGRDGNPVRPAIVWLDVRRADARRVLSPPAILLARASGLYPFIEYAIGLSRSNWIRQNEPEVWADTHKFLFLPGFLTFRLTGEFRESSGNIIGAIPYDTKRSAWAADSALTWRLFPVEHEKLPELLHPTQVLGTVTAGAAEATGIPAGLPLVAASNDKACEVLGSGCRTPGQGSISFGTTATINTNTSRYVELMRMLPPYPAAVAGEFCTEVGVVRGLWLVSWFKEEFGLRERELGRTTGRSAEELLELMVRDVPPGSQGLICQPTWAVGPGLAPYVKGALLGFGDVHTRAHVYRAILEGIVYALREGADRTARANGVPITEVRAGGGGSRSDTLMQITADVFGIPVYRPHTPETSLIGAAILATVGAGMYPDVARASRAMTRTMAVFEPDPSSVEVYDALYQRVYSKAYRRMLPLYKGIQEATGYPRL